MMSLYQNGETFLHKTRAGFKLTALFVLSAAVFMIHSTYWLFGLFFLLGMLVFCSKIQTKYIFAQCKSAFIMIGIICSLQVILTDLSTAALIGVRLSTLVLAATLVTTTTQVADLVGGIESCLRPIQRWVPVAKISLAIALAIRFIPLAIGIAKEVKEAARVRGQDRRLFAITMPIIIRMIKMGSHVADAIDARQS